MSQFYKEVCQQPDAIRDTISFNLGQSFPNLQKSFLFTGMGSSLFASELVSGLLNSKGINAMAMDSSELLHYYYPIAKNYQTVIVSQSGESFEAKEIIKKCPDAITITNTVESTLAKKSHQVFYTKAGIEYSVASNKSFTATVALLLQLGANTNGDSLEEELYLAARQIERELANAVIYRKQIGKFLSADHPIIFLGRGPSLVTARQGALTLKETARIYTEAMSAAQFRHGPYELLKENLQVVFFNPMGRTYSLNKNFVQEMADLGAKVLYVSDERLEHENILSLSIPSINEFVSVIPYTFITQLIVEELSQQRGIVAGEAELINKITNKE